MSASLRLVTWNVQKAYRPESFARELAAILAEDPDFVCLQEVDTVANTIVDDVLWHFAKYRHLRLSPDHDPNRKAMVSIIACDEWVDKSLELIGFDYGEPHVNAMIVGTFSCGVALLRVASIHQPAHVRPSTRLHVTRAIVRWLSASNTSTLVCGDFNTGFPRENHRLKQVFASTFRCQTNAIGATCFWHRLEPFRLRSRFARWLGRTFGVRVSIDHVFATHDLVDGASVAVRRLDFEASDHLPIMVELRFPAAS